MKTFLGRILLPTILAFSLFACFCPIDIPDRVTLQEAVGIYQRLGQNSSFELIELKEDTTYLHTILGMHDTLTNTGKYTVCTSTVSSVELAGFDTFGDSLFVFAYDSLCYMVLKTGELNLKYDWDFGEKKTKACRMIGNAFPPPVARAVGVKIMKVLNDNKYNYGFVDFKSEETISREVAFA